MANMAEIYRQRGSPCAEINLKLLKEVQQAPLSFLKHFVAFNYPAKGTKANPQNRYNYERILQHWHSKNRIRSTEASAEHGRNCAWEIIDAAVREGRQDLFAPIAAKFELIHLKFGRSVDQPPDQNIQEWAIVSDKRLTQAYFDNMEVCFYDSASRALRTADREWRHCLRINGVSEEHIKFWAENHDAPITGAISKKLSAWGYKENPFISRIPVEQILKLVAPDETRKTEMRLYKKKFDAHISSLRIAKRGSEENPHPAERDYDEEEKKSARAAAATAAPTRVFHRKVGPKPQSGKSLIHPAFINNRPVSQPTIEATMSEFWSKYGLLPSLHHFNGVPVPFVSNPNTYRGPLGDYRYDIGHLGVGEDEPMHPKLLPFVYAPTGVVGRGFDEKLRNMAARLRPRIERQRTRETHRMKEVTERRRREEGTPEPEGMVGTLAREEEIGNYDSSPEPPQLPLTKGKSVMTSVPQEREVMNLGPALGSSSRPPKKKSAAPLLGRSMHLDSSLSSYTNQYSRPAGNTAEVTASNYLLQQRREDIAGNVPLDGEGMDLESLPGPSSRPLKDKSHIDANTNIPCPSKKSDVTIGVPPDRAVVDLDPALGLSSRLVEKASSVKKSVGADFPPEEGIIGFNPALSSSSTLLRKNIRAAASSREFKELGGTPTSPKKRNTIPASTTQEAQFMTLGPASVLAPRVSKQGHDADLQVAVPPEKKSMEPASASLPAPRPSKKRSNSAVDAKPKMAIIDLDPASRSSKRVKSSVSTPQPLNLNSPPSFSTRQSSPAKKSNVPASLREERGAPTINLVPNRLSNQASTRSAGVDSTTLKIETKDLDATPEPALRPVKKTRPALSNRKLLELDTTGTTSVERATHSSSVATSVPPESISASSPTPMTADSPPPGRQSHRSTSSSHSTAALPAPTQNSHVLVVLPSTQLTPQTHKTPRLSPQPQIPHTRKTSESSLQPPTQSTPQTRKTLRSFTPVSSQSKSKSQLSVVIDSRPHNFRSDVDRKASKSDLEIQAAVLEQSESGDFRAPLVQSYPHPEETREAGGKNKGGEDVGGVGDGDGNENKG